MIRQNISYESKYSSAKVDDYVSYRWFFFKISDATPEIVEKAEINLINDSAL
jgi:hypothetical protein